MYQAVSLSGLAIPGVNYAVVTQLAPTPKKNIFRGHSTVVVRDLPKVKMWVRSPLPAYEKQAILLMVWGRGFKSRPPLCFFLPA